VVVISKVKAVNIPPGSSVRVFELRLERFYITDLLYNGNNYVGEGTHKVRFDIYSQPGALYPVRHIGFGEYDGSRAIALYGDGWVTPYISATDFGTLLSRLRVVVPEGIFTVTYVNGGSNSATLPQFIALYGYYV